MEDGDDGFGGDRRDHFHHNEAISAVVDEGFLGEEDDDYEDLYNDVNVGEGFLQSLQRNEAPQGFKTDEKQEEQRTNDLSGVESMGNSAPAAAVAIPGVGPGDGRMEKDQASAVEEAQKGYPGPEYRGNELVPKGPPTGPGGGMRIEVRQPLVRATGEVGGQLGNRMQSHPGGNENYGRIGVGMAPGGNYNVVSTNGSGPGGGGANSGGGTILFVGELHWWTTDAELESELSKYGQVKEVKFFDEKASGKSKGYCQAEFYDPGAAASCKEGMNGHVFNGRPCVVAFASPYSVRRMGEAQVNKSQAMAQATQQQGRRGQGPGDIGGNGRGNAIATGANYQGGDQGRNFGRGGWGRGGGMGNRGQMGPMRNRMGMGGRGIIGNGGSGFGQGLATATPPLLHPQTMMGQGFDPSYGAAMGRMGGYGGFPGGPAPPFSGILPSFPPVGGVGLPSVAPHVNPAFFGRGMPSNGMGMMPVTGVDGSAMGMWSDPNMAGWGGEEQGGRAGESSYGEDATSEHQYGEGSHERGGWSNPAKEKDRASERELPGAGPERRYRDDREPGWERGEKDAEPGQEWPERRHDDREMGWDRGRDRERDRDRDRDRERDRDRGREREQERGRSRDDRDRYREERDRFTDHHRHRDRELDHDDDWERRRSSRTRSKPRMSQEEEHRHRSREVEHGKRRRLPSE